MVELPKYVIDKIEELSRKYKIEKDKLISEYMDIFNDPFVQTDPQFKTDDDRHGYASRVLWIRIAAQPTTKDYIVIPFGIQDPRLTQSGKVIARLLAYVKSGDKFERKIILFKDSTANEVNNVQLFHAYKVKLSEFRDILMATMKTKFENPKPLPMEPLKFLLEELGIPLITIEQAAHMPSKKRDERFTDEFDLRAIRCIVTRWNKWTRRSGFGEGAVYNVSDDSVNQTHVSEDGVIIPTEMTVWTPASQLKYDVESEIVVVGTIDISDTKEPAMNAVCVIPLHAKPIITEGD